MQKVCSLSSRKPFMKMHTVNSEKMGSSLRVALEVCCLEPAKLRSSDCTYCMQCKHGFCSCFFITAARILWEWNDFHFTLFNTKISSVLSATSRRSCFQDRGQLTATCPLKHGHRVSLNFLSYHHFYSFSPHQWKCVICCVEMVS